ncbi:S24/S26 family peptidase [Streptomyces sp. NPDC057682]|uniref:S24/S26 family peptidase n=1 Tax=unclassified Streptomyces TaxID=2593676 RepID=UPI003666762D
MTAAVLGGMAGCLLAAGLAAWWVRYTYVAVTVRGHSMMPTLRPGTRVLIRRGTRGVRRDGIVVVACPEPGTAWRGKAPVGRDLAATEWYIKRAVALAGEPFGGAPVPAGCLAVVGDSPHSEDSRSHGPCPMDQVLGSVVRTLGQPPAAVRGPAAGPGEPAGRQSG